MKRNINSIIISSMIMLGYGHIDGQTIAGQESGPTEANNIFNIIYNNIFLFLTVLVIFGIFLSVIDMVWALIMGQKNRLLRELNGEDVQAEVQTTSESFWSKLSNKMWNLVPKDKEQDIDLGHEYDGIRELDNSLPPWWLYMFYGTIIWSAVYLWYFHGSDHGMNQEQEYLSAMEAGEMEKAKFLSLQANTIDEKTVTILTDGSAIAEGKDIYIANCLVCHGANGEGTVGPNFTDKYWLHGGGIQDLFKTIKYGVPEKGMISWQSQLRPTAIQKVSSFILSLQGTNPPNPKAPQGDLYEPATSVTAKTDTTNVNQTNTTK